MSDFHVPSNHFLDSTLTKYTSSESSSESNSMVGSLITNEFKSITTAISQVVTALTPMKGAMIADVPEAKQIASLLTNIVEEIVFTVAQVIKTIGLRKFLGF